MAYGLGYGIKGYGGTSAAAVITEAEGNSSGVATAIGLSSSIFASVGNSTGVAIATGLSGSISGSVGNITGIATVLGAGENAAALVVSLPSPIDLGGGGFSYGKSYQIYQRNDKQKRKYNYDEDDIIILLCEMISSGIL